MFKLKDLPFFLNPRPIKMPMSSLVIVDPVGQKGKTYCKKDEQRTTRDLKSSLDPS